MHSDLFFAHVRPRLKADERMRGGIPAFFEKRRKHGHLILFRRRLLFSGIPFICAHHTPAISSVQPGLCDIYLQQRDVTELVLFWFHRSRFSRDSSHSSPGLMQSALIRRRVWYVLAHTGYGRPCQPGTVPKKKNGRNTTQGI